jgi:hypothetical protein
MLLGTAASSFEMAVDVADQGWGGMVTCRLAGGRRVLQGTTEGGAYQPCQGGQGLFLAAIYTPLIT